MQIINEAIIRDLEEAIDLMQQLDVNKREATDAWVKAVNQKARQLDAYYTSNPHIPNEQLDPLVAQFAADEIAEYKELAKATPVEWHQSQKYLQVVYVNQRVFVPHCNEAGTVRKIGNNGFEVDVMLDSGEYLQTHRKFIEPINSQTPTKYLESSSRKPLYKEETAKAPLIQVQNSPTDEAPKMRQLELFK